jgi:hypothetical protein
VDLGQFIFGLANGRTELLRFVTITWIVLSSRVAGKCMAIYAFATVAAGLNYSFPVGVCRIEPVLDWIIDGNGLTFFLFFSGGSFRQTASSRCGKVGSMLSIDVVAIAVMAGKLLKIKKPADCPIILILS